MRLPDRRHFLGAAATLPLTAAAVAADKSKAEPGSIAKPALRNAIELGNRFILWQSACGAPDPVKCPYRTPGFFNAYHLHGVGPMTRALYRLYDVTGNADYKTAADRYAVFFLSTIHSPLEPYTNLQTLDGKLRNMLSAAWMYGKALSPCYEYFCLHNPREDALELKANSIYRWLQKHRREDSYFGVGYPSAKNPDAQNSCDLGEVGNGLMGFYRISKQPKVLQDALGLANFFLTDHEPGSGRGIWSPKLGVWLIGPWPRGGAENSTNQILSETGWGWSAYIDGEFLLRLRAEITDNKLRDKMADYCVKSLQWCFDACQFEDGGHGMFGRDDKWLGMTAAAILLYLLLKADKLIPASVESAYGPRVEKSWRWLLKHTDRENFATDGMIRVTGTTTKKPLENLVWMMAWTTEALVEGERVFGS